ncbi:hypothetical protein RHGRI_026541 [Rhododendron griersonianum]|uniref:Uncharacterized protein n=1 Tax=Rhododendron griersonianum TaxID=479676 RepID=A0AAV6IUR8_9ERIC|nr:hypothetical protein RHGRI_026541 [Rhododendron griersonianum]
MKSSPCKAHNQNPSPLSLSPWPPSLFHPPLLLSIASSIAAQLPSHSSSSSEAGE